MKRALKGHVHMMSAQGGGRWLPQKQMQSRSLLREVAWICRQGRRESKNSKISQTSRVHGPLKNMSSVWLVNCTTYCAPRRSFDPPCFPELVWPLFHKHEEVASIPSAVWRLSSTCSLLSQSPNTKNNCSKQCYLLFIAFDICAAAIKYMCNL